MSSTRNWKDTFVAGMYASAELREQKALLCLLGYVVHRTHSKLRMCWVSQRTLAEVSNCNERNIKRMLSALQTLGAIGQVRFSALPPKDRAAINAVSPTPINKNANVYFPCLGWAESNLDAPALPAPTRRRPIRISEEDRKRGSDKAADRRRRYAPKDLVHPPIPPTVPDHEEYLFLNAIGQNGGRSGTPISQAKGGRSTTRIYTEYKPAADSALNNGQTVGASDAPSSQEIETQGDSSSLSLPHTSSQPSADGDSEAVAPVARAAPLPGAWGQGPRSLPTELGVAGARANERRAL